MEAFFPVTSCSPMQIAAVALYEPEHYQPLSSNRRIAYTTFEGPNSPRQTKAPRTDASPDPTLLTRAYSKREINGYPPACRMLQGTLLMGIGEKLDSFERINQQQVTTVLYSTGRESSQGRRARECHGWTQRGSASQRAS